MTRIPTTESVLEKWPCSQWVRENSATSEERKGRLTLTSFHISFEPKALKFLRRNKENVSLKLKDVRDIRLISVPSAGPGIEIVSATKESLIFVSFGVPDLGDIVFRMNTQRTYAVQVSSKSSIAV